MKPKMRRNFTGTFAAENLGANRWRLAQGGPDAIELYLQGTDVRAEANLAQAPLREVGVEWAQQQALLTFSTGQGAQERIGSVAALSILVHEPLPKLYDSLPLATFDAKARRFWRRVFWLVRIPGGRRLLKVLARRRRTA